MYTSNIQKAVKVYGVHALGNKFIVVLAGNPVICIKHIRPFIPAGTQLVDFHGV